MNNRQQLKHLIFALIVISMIFPGSALATSLKERMKARLPQIIQLKAQGVIGENHRGYLELRRQDDAAPPLVAAENQDRQTVYDAIARQQNTSPEVVAQRRAAQLASRAATGTWLQNNQGEWYQKR